MKTFTGMRPLGAILDICKKRGWPVDMSKFNAGSDHFSFKFTHGNVSGTCIVNSVNGRFFGRLARGMEFNSDSQVHDKKPWFSCLLNTVLTRDEKTKGGGS